MRLVARAGRALRFLGIDQAVAFTLAGHFWNVISGPVLLVLLIWRLTQAERGVLFNYVGLCQFQILFAVGVGTVMQQLASRERAFLMVTSAGTLGGNPLAKARLAAVFRIAMAWFSGVMITSSALVMPVGWLLFARAEGVEGINWQLAWILTVLVAAAQGFGYSLFLFLTGCGDVTPVSRVTALHQVTMTVTQCATLIAGAKLLSHPLAGMSGLAVTFGWVALARRRMLADLWSADAGGSTLRWHADVWPLKWRVLLSLMSVGVIIPVLNLAALKFYGADVAGQVGLSTFILMAIQAMGTGWVGTKVPSFGVLAAQKKWPELNAMFRAVLLRSLAFIGVLTALVILADLAIYQWQGSLLQRGAEAALGPSGLDLGLKLHAPPGASKPLLPPGLLAILGLSVLAMHVVQTQTAFLRAHCREPMLVTYVTLAAGVAVTLVVTGRFATVEAMIVGYACWVVVAGLALGTRIFLIHRRQWHREEAAAAE